MAIAFTFALGHAPARAAAADAPIEIAAVPSKFTPTTVHARVGEKTTLRITSAEGVHGIESSDLSISATTLMPGKTVDVSFTPKSAGTYVIRCTVPCGDSHEDMKLTVVVTDN